MGLPAVRRRASARSAATCSISRTPASGSTIRRRATFTPRRARAAPLPGRARCAQLAAGTRRSAWACAARTASLHRPGRGVGRARLRRRGPLPQPVRAPAGCATSIAARACSPTSTPTRATARRSWPRPTPGRGRPADARRRSRSSAAHDVFFTLGEHVGRSRTARSRPAGITWLPTRQPILLELAGARRAPDGGAFTTVHVVEHRPDAARRRRAASTAARTSSSSASSTCRARTPERLEVAISGAAPRERIVAAGWSVIDAHAVSRTLDDYRALPRRARAASCRSRRTPTWRRRSGWFSTRSAAYLASGRPVVLQDTGFSAHLPLGARAARVHDARRGGRGAGRPCAPTTARACAHARDGRRASASAAERRVRAPPRRRRGCERWRGSSSPATSSAIRSAATPGSVAHYLLGLRALGHDVWFYEDTGHYALAYDPDDERVRAATTATASAPPADVPRPPRPRRSLGVRRRRARPGARPGGGPRARAAARRRPR